MRTKRKRIDGTVTGSKRRKVSHCIPRNTTHAAFLSHDVLSVCYPEVVSLRQYLADSLPVTSRARRRKLTTHVLEDGSAFLDTTLVGVPTKVEQRIKEDRNREFILFTQSQQRSTSSNNGIREEDRLTEVRVH